jgi:hypothetical protein
MGNNNNNNQAGNPNTQAENPNAQTGAPNTQPDLPDAKKTTPDEGKSFDKPVELVCVQDCFRGGKRYRPGDTMIADKCPPFFIVKLKKGDTKK